MQRPVTVPDARAQRRLPLYWRVLRLHHVRPTGWQRVLLVEGVVGVSVVLVLADVATAWTLLVLPLASVVVVKANDVLVAALGRPPAAPLPSPSWRDYAPVALLAAVLVLFVLPVGRSTRLVALGVLLAAVVTAAVLRRRDGVTSADGADADR